MINLLASILVWLTGLYLIGLAVGLWLSPARATQFLGGFASSAFTHYLELGLRLIAGVAILRYAPQMLFSNFFFIFGWVLVVTTVGLFAVPWQWHQRFAQWGVPYATRNLRLVAVLHSFSADSSKHPLFLGGTEQWKAQAYSLISHHYFSVNQTF